MKRAVIATFALVLFAAVSAVPAFANGIAQGKHMSVAVDGLPDTCPAGEVMSGKLFIQLSPDMKIKKQSITVELSVETAFGDVTLETRTFKMPAGMTRSVALVIPVPKGTPAGDYNFHVTVSDLEEQLTVDHAVTVY